MKRILIACEFSGIVRDAFAAKGWDAWSCDLEPSESPGNHFQCDVFSIIDKGWDMMIAHPPCTYLSNAGNRWYDKNKYKGAAYERERLREAALMFFLQLATVPIAKICLENPKGFFISKRYQPPSQIIQPFQFGHTTTKETWLWLKNLPPLQPTNIVTPNKYRLGKKMYGEHHLKSSYMPMKDRVAFRSRTFNGIANAMADQWGNL